MNTRGNCGDRPKEHAFGVSIWETGRLSRLWFYAGYWFYAGFGYGYGHPSTKLFISHGGLLSLQEAVHCGVPVLGVPLFADQSMNLVGLRDKGAALVVKYNDVNNATLSEAVQQLLSNESYRQNSARLSKIFRDRPQDPLDTAIYWVEYVAKYRGAEHMRSPAQELAWYQYLLLDVALFLLVAMFATIFLGVLALRKIIGCVKEITEEKEMAEKKCK